MTRTRTSPGSTRKQSQVNGWVWDVFSHSTALGNDLLFSCLGPGLSVRRPQFSSGSASIPRIWPGCSSLVEHVLSVNKALGSIPRRQIVPQTPRVSFCSHLCGFTPSLTRSPQEGGVRHGARGSPRSRHRHRCLSPFLFITVS